MAQTTSDTAFLGFFFLSFLFLRFRRLSPRRIGIALVSAGGVLGGRCFRVGVLGPSLGSGSVPVITVLGWLAPVAVTASWRLQKELCSELRHLVKQEACCCCVGVGSELSQAFNAFDLQIQVDLFSGIVSVNSFIRPRFCQSLRCFARAVLLLPVGDVEFFEGRSLSKTALDSALKY